MAAKVTRKDIAEYKAFAKKEGRDVSHLTDDQMVAQIRILKGGIAAPSPSDVDDILARAKVTEKIFEQCRQDVLADLRKALADFQTLDRASTRKPGSRTSSPLPQRARRVVELRRKLLAYPPSMLGPKLKKILELVSSWAVHAEKVLKGDSPEGGEVLLDLSDRLAKVLRGA